MSSESKTDESSSRGRSLEDLSKDELLGFTKKLREAQLKAKKDKEQLEEQLQKVTSEKEIIRAKSLELLNKCKELQLKNKALEESSENELSAKQNMVETLTSQCLALTEKLDKIKSGTCITLNLNFSM